MSAIAGEAVEARGQPMAESDPQRPKLLGSNYCKRLAEAFRRLAPLAIARVLKPGGANGAACLYLTKWLGDEDVEHLVLPFALA
jgi:hypothetical protein